MYHKQSSNINLTQEKNRVFTISTTNSVCKDITNILTAMIFISFFIRFCIFLIFVIDYNTFINEPKKILFKKLKPKNIGRKQNYS